MIAKVPHCSANRSLNLVCYIHDGLASDARIRVVYREKATSGAGAVHSSITAVMSSFVLSENAPESESSIKAVTKSPSGEEGSLNMRRARCVSSEVKNPTQSCREMMIHWP